MDRRGRAWGKRKWGISMGFAESVRTVLRRKYLTFSGRAGRSEYWWFQLFFWGLLLALFVLFGVVTDATRRPDGYSSSTTFIIVVIGLFILAMFLPQAALHVRRFHDRNMSGWWYFVAVILSFVPYIGRGAGIGILIVSALRGTEGPNKYGQDPLRPEGRAEVFA